MHFLALKCVATANPKPSLFENKPSALTIIIFLFHVIDYVF
jgi:hypothetical protein